MTTKWALDNVVGFYEGSQIVSWQLAVVSWQLCQVVGSISNRLAGDVALACEVGGSPSEPRSRDRGQESRPLASREGFIRL